MALKKLNAVVGLLVVALLFGHMLTMTWSLYTGWYSFVLCKTLARMTGTLAVIHVVITFTSLFFFHDGSTLNKYKRKNMRVILQRGSGILVLALLFLHINAYSFIVSGEQLSLFKALFIGVTETVFISCAMTHTAVSFSRAWISLGVIQSEKTADLLDKILYVVCGVCTAAAVIAVLRFLLHSI